MEHSKSIDTLPMQRRTRPELEAWFAKVDVILEEVDVVPVEELPDDAA